MIRGAAMVVAAALLLGGCGGVEGVGTANETVAAPTASTVQQVPPPAANKTAPALPADVAAFKEKRDSCDHFRGEDAYDEERGKFLAERLAETCAGTDKALADLRTTHAADPAVIAALADYETQVE